MRAINENKVKKFLKDGNAIFLKACADVPKPYGKPGIPATKRQASRWLMKKGIAYKTLKGII